MYIRVALLMALMCFAAHAEDFYFSGAGGFMIDVKPAENPPSSVPPIFGIPLHRNNVDAPVVTQKRVTSDQTPETAETSTPAPVYPMRMSGQNIAISAGLPTFVSTYYNPTVEVRGVSWATAATSALGGAVLGMGLEMYSQRQSEGAADYVRLVQSGTILSGAIFSGVITGQAVQRSVLINSNVFGLSSGGTGSQLLSGFVGDAFGSAIASTVYSAGAYAFGWADAADARMAMAKGAAGSVVMAAGKAAGVQTLFSITGTGGTIATLGPYAITYLAAIGAVYMTDWIFEGMEQSEASELIKRGIDDRERKLQGI